MKRYTLLVLAMVLVLAMLSCAGGLAKKTAKDIDTAAEMILPEYLVYVEADPKLDTEQKKDRQRQIQALRDVVRNAQK